MMKNFISLSKWATLCIFIGSLLSGCSANWHLKKAIAKDPSILQPKELVLIDTVVITSSLRVDTLAYFRTDTITIEKERLRVQIKRIHDTLRISAECQADTVRIFKEVEVPGPVVYKPRAWYERILLPVAFVVFVLMFGRSIFDRWANSR
jgi:hypothetical protein